MTALRGRAAHLAAALASITFLGASCQQSALGLMPGVLNDTHNLSLRRAILAYGTNQVCKEVQQRSMPLRLREEEPIVGRYFPSACASRQTPNNNLLLQLAGRGYVWTNMSQRLGFEAASTVEYDTDFLLEGSTMYVYFRPRASAPPTFVTKFVEAPQAAFFNSLPIGPGGQPLTNSFGAQIMGGQLARGFTVIRESNGNVTFGLGIIPPGQRPAEAYKNLDRARPILANERSAIYAGQRDFVGPFEVPADKKAGLVITVEGAPAIDALVVPRAIGDAWLAVYATQAATTPPPGPPAAEDAVPAGPVYRRALAVPPGLYYLVLDNTPTAGRTSPVASGQPAIVSYAVTLE
jgi:hypothetical protein